MGQKEGYLSNPIKWEERPVILSLQIGVGWQRLDHVYNVDKCLVIGKEHNTGALKHPFSDVTITTGTHRASASQEAGPEQGWLSLRANVRKTPWCYHWKRTHSATPHREP